MTSFFDYDEEDDSMSLSVTFNESGRLEYKIPQSVAGITKGELGSDITPWEEAKVVLDKDLKAVVSNNAVMSYAPISTADSDKFHMYYPDKKKFGQVGPGWAGVPYSGFTKFSHTTCPRVGGIVAEAAHMLGGYKWNDRKIACWYDRSQIAEGCEYVKEWSDLKKREKDNPQWWDDELMEKFCGQVSKKDPSKPEMLTCAECKSWARSPTGKSKADYLMMEWCGGRPQDDEACKCIKNAQTPQFAAMQADTGASAGCWYGPCADVTMEKYLSPNLYVDAQKECPDICGVFWSRYGEGKINVDSADISTTCEKARPPDIPKPPPSDDSGSKEEFVKKHPLVIAGASIALLIGVGMIVAVSLRMKKKNNVSETI